MTGAMGSPFGGSTGGSGTFDPTFGGTGIFDPRLSGMGSSTGLDAGSQFFDPYSAFGGGGIGSPSAFDLTGTGAGGLTDFSPITNPAQNLGGQIQNPAQAGGGIGAATSSTNQGNAAPTSAVGATPTESATGIDELRRAMGGSPQGPTGFQPAQAPSSGVLWPPYGTQAQAGGGAQMTTEPLGGWAPGAASGVSPGSPGAISPTPAGAPGTQAGAAAGPQPSTDILAGARAPDGTPDELQALYEQRPSLWDPTQPGSANQRVASAFEQLSAPAAPTAPAPPAAPTDQSVATTAVKPGDMPSGTIPGSVAAAPGAGTTTAPSAAPAAAPTPTPATTATTAAGAGGGGRALGMPPGLQGVFSLLNMLMPGLGNILQQLMGGATGGGGNMQPPVPTADQYRQAYNEYVNAMGHAPPGALTPDQWAAQHGGGAAAPAAATTPTPAATGASAGQTFGAPPSGSLGEAADPFVAGTPSRGDVSPSTIAGPTTTAAAYDPFTGRRASVPLNAMQRADGRVSTGDAYLDREVNAALSANPAQAAAIRGNAATANQPASPSNKFAPGWAGPAQPTRGDPRGMGPYIVQRARAHGIDPSVALRVAQGEGLNYRNYNAAIGDRAITPGGGSYGAFQLRWSPYRNMGMGNDFQRATGLDPRNPDSEPAMINYALARASREGWGAWTNTARKLGLGRWTGISRNRVAAR